MRARQPVVHKHLRLSEAKIRRAQKYLNTATETATVERALDAVIAEYERNRRVHQANDRFLKSGIEIRDVYGTLAD